MQNRRDEASKDALARCPRCGSSVTATPEPYDSRFRVRCALPTCGHFYTHAVRASAFSLPGVLQVAGTALCALAAYLGTRGAVVELRIAALFAALLAGGAILRFVLHLAANVVLQSSAHSRWKAEMIAYLAPAPSLRRMRDEEAEPGGPGPDAAEPPADLDRGPRGAP
jgi:hypothetical protein